MSGIELFKEEHPSLDSYWRSIILFGRNVASYKFSLAKSLLEIVPTGKTVVTLEDLSEPFSRHICEHLKTAPKQATSNSSQFLDSCKSYNAGVIAKEELLSITSKKGFNNVIDAFHVVNSGELPIRFYQKNYHSDNKSIVLTDELFKLYNTPFSKNLLNEAESRWNLIETSWELGISRNLLYVHYDDENKGLLMGDRFRRKPVTSARDALNGYQKGKCFYCFDAIALSDFEANICDVDHFFPHSLQPFIPEINLNGVWNLVLACPNCNRGKDGKFAQVPDIKYLTRLHKRNEFLISSHHPLRETLMSQTGVTEKDRVSLLREVDKQAINRLIHRWKTEQVGEAVF